VRPEHLRLDPRAFTSHQDPIRLPGHGQGRARQGLRNVHQSSWRCDGARSRCGAALERGRRKVDTPLYRGQFRHAVQREIHVATDLFLNTRGRRGSRIGIPYAHTCSWPTPTIEALSTGATMAGRRACRRAGPRRWQLPSWNCCSVSSTTRSSACGPILQCIRDHLEPMRHAALGANAIPLMITAS